MKWISSRNEGESSFTMEENSVTREEISEKKSIKEDGILVINYS